MLSKGIYVLHFCEKVKEYFCSLNATDLRDDKKFWGVVESLLSNKVVPNKKTTIVEDDNILKKCITPVHKKGEKTFKDNYRPASILSNISKVYERLMFKQISEYFESILSKFSVIL